ncbi:MAG: hypothetical protein ABI833_15770 [Acidobacteriota bacterium]
MKGLKSEKEYRAVPGFSEHPSVISWVGILASVWPSLQYGAIFSGSSWSLPQRLQTNNHPSGVSINPIISEVSPSALSFAPNNGREWQTPDTVGQVPPLWYGYGFRQRLYFAVGINSYYGPVAVRQRCGVARSVVIRLRVQDNHKRGVKTLSLFRFQNGRFSRLSPDAYNGGLVPDLHFVRAADC